MNPWLAAGLLVCFVSIVAGQIIKARAFLLLSNEQPNQVITYHALRSAKRLIAIMGLVMILFMLTAVIVGLGLPLRVRRSQHPHGLRGLQALNLPAPFVAATRRSRLVMTAGIFLRVWAHDTAVCSKIPGSSSRRKLHELVGRRPDHEGDNDTRSQD